MLYVIETHDTNKPDETRTFAISKTPGHANMSNEEKTDGWLGTTNNIWEYAHGEFETVEDAMKFIEFKMPGAEILENDEYDESDDIIMGYPEDSLWNCEDWFSNSSIDDLGVDSCMTDDEIRKIADQLDEEALAEGARLTDSVFYYLKTRI